MTYGPAEFALIGILLTFFTSMFSVFCVGVSAMNQAHKGDKELHERIDEWDAEIDKRLAYLKTALRKKARFDYRMSQKCRRLERRVKQLETLTG
jgi:hypothetical protein